MADDSSVLLQGEPWGPTWVFVEVPLWGTAREQEPRFSTSHALNAAVLTSMTASLLHTKV